jgi:hypothetical protein
MKEVVDTEVSSLENIKSRTIEIMDSVAEYIKGITEKIRGYFGNMIPDLVGRLQTMLDWVAKEADKWGVGRGISKAISGTFTGKSTKAGSLLGGSGWGARQDSIGQLGMSTDQLVANVKQAGGNARKTLSDYVEKDAKNLYGIGEKYVVPFFTGMIDGFTAKIEGMMAGLIPSELSKLWGQAGSGFFMLKLKMAKQWGFDTSTSAKMESGDKWRRVADEFGSTWTEAVKRVAESFKTAQEIMADGLGDILSGWTDAFDQLMEKGSSFVDFMDNMFQSILQSFEHMVSQMVAQKLYASVFGTAGGVPTTGGESASSWMSTLLGLYSKGDTNFTYPVGASSTSGTGYTGSFAGGSQKVILSVSNNGTPVALKKVGQQVVGKDLVVSYVMDEMEHNPRFRDIVRGGR